MEKLFLVIDLDRCYGCKVCQTACKLEHGFPVGAQPCIEPYRYERVDNSGKLQCDFIPTVCLHCTKPACTEACPTGAISRDENGFIIIDKTACLGCGTCEEACNFGAISIIRDGSRCTYAAKCDVCLERRERGMEPACVQHCLGQAITVCDEESLNEKIKDRNTWSCGHTVYLSDKIVDFYS